MRHHCISYDFENMNKHVATFSLLEPHCASMWRKLLQLPFGSSIY